ncbi:hypothetical protein [Enterococcus sp. CWB-B31]|uniref:hypothetical protein n=1 Tax=Enterococcus sp. CWB-B31 TaxID=2885159 RepID=UPI001E5252CE|nr:hypothetical protein [Enterococcus sp. CWB-B31]MCB5954528.1 hypothetical protein [Enterococcus sp. CWB-B31]
MKQRYKGAALVKLIWLDDFYWETQNFYLYDLVYKVNRYWNAEGQRIFSAVLLHVLLIIDSFTRVCLESIAKSEFSRNFWWKSRKKAQVMWCIGENF